MSGKRGSDVGLWAGAHGRLARMWILLMFALTACGIRVGNPRQAGTGTGNTPGEKRKEGPSGGGKEPTNKPRTGGVDEDIPGGTPQRNDVPNSLPNPHTATSQTGGLPPESTPTPEPIAGTRFRLELDGAVPPTAAQLFVRVVGLRFSKDDGTFQVVTLQAPIELNVLAPTGTLSFGVLIPSGRWSEVGLQLDVPSCLGGAKDQSLWTCRVATGERLLTFAAPSGGLEGGGGAVSAVRLRLQASGVAWDLPEWNKGFPPDARSEGYTIVLTRSAGSAAVSP